MKIPCHKYREQRALQSEAREQPKEILPIAFLPYTIAVDTREQAPWSFREITDVENKQRVILVARATKQTLQTGDYSIVGLDNRLTVERKSGSDIISSVSYGRDRFMREHQRMQAMIAAGGCACVVIESPITDIRKAIDDRQGKFTFRSFWKTYISWLTQFRVPWLFCPSRRGAEVTAFHILKSFWKHHATEGGYDG